MPRDVLDSLLEFLSKRIPELTNLEISWFGGEPLLAIDVLDEVMSFCHSEATKHSVALSSGISTNGHLLSPNIFSLLVQKNVLRYQITMDGPKQFHNARRKRKNAEGDYDLILRNLFFICETNANFDLNIRIHVDRANSECMDDLMADITLIGKDPRTTLCFERVKNLGHQLPPDIKPMGQSEFHCFVTKFISNPKYAHFKFDNVLDKIDTHVCYAALPNNFVVRSDGRLQKCTVALNNSINTVGKIEKSGRLSINDQYLKWISVWQQQDTALLACPARYFKSSSTLG